MGPLLLADDALQVLFAPYCGGLARSEALRDALMLLRGQRLEGCRPVEGSDGHGFVLSWSDERAPLDVIHCQLFSDTTGCFAKVQSSDASIGVLADGLFSIRW